MTLTMYGKDLIQVKGLEGFFYLSYVSNDYAINKVGTVINVHTNKRLKGHVVKPSSRVTNMTGGYVKFNIGGRHYFRHRLLAFTFKELPEGYVTGDDLLVNHKDGIPGNDDLDNLEWCTHSENTKHAYRNGLHPNKTRPVLVKDFFDDKIKRFGSITETSEFLGWSLQTTYYRLYRHPGVNFDGVAIKFDDGTPWKKEPYKDSLSFKPVAAYNPLSKKTLICNHSGELSKMTGVKQGTINKKIKTKSLSPIHGWIFSAYEPGLTWPEYTDDQLRVVEDNPCRVPKGYYLFNKKNGVRKLYTKKLELMNFLNLDDTSFNNAVNRGRLFDGKYLIEKIDMPY